MQVKANCGGDAKLHRSSRGRADGRCLHNQFRRQNNAGRGQRLAAGDHKEESHGDLQRW
jgi:hypothetical protein